MKQFRISLYNFFFSKELSKIKFTNSKIAKIALFCLLSLFILLISFMVLVSTAKATTSEAEKKHYNYYTDIENLPYYVQLNAGLSYPRKPNGDFKGSFSKANVYEFEIGYKLGEDFRLGMNIGYRNNLKTKYSTTSIVEHGLLSTNNFSYRGSSYSGMLNLSYDVVTISGFTPYLTLGAGMSHNIIKGGEVETIYLTDGTTYPYPAGKKNNFAYKAGLGTKLAINDSGYINLCYQFVDLGKITSGRVVGLPSGKSESVTPKTENLRTHEALLGIGYKF